MSDSTLIAAQQIELAILPFNLATAREGDVVRLPQIEWEVAVIDADLRERAASVTVDVRPAGDKSGIEVLAVGFGDNREQAAGQAAFQWATGVFTPVRHFLTKSSHTCLEADYYVPVGTDLFWRVHFGPLFSRVLAGDSGRAPSFGTQDVIRALHDAIKADVPSQGWSVFWIEAFAYRQPDGVKSTCRCRNFDWQHGQAALTRWAEKWRMPADAAVTARQFLLFEEVERAEVDQDRIFDVSMSTPSPTKQPWWKRGFRA